MEKPIEYDWSYWTEYSGTAELRWSATDKAINFARLANTAEPVLFFHSSSLYEDELADNGTSTFDIRLVCIACGIHCV